MKDSSVNGHNTVIVASQLPCSLKIDSAGCSVPLLEVVWSKLTLSSFLPHNLKRCILKGDS